MEFKEQENVEKTIFINPFAEAEKYILKDLLSQNQPGLKALKDFPFLLSVATENSHSLVGLSHELNATGFSIIIPGNKVDARKRLVRKEENKITSPEEIYQETRIIGSVLFYNVLGKVKDNVAFLNLFLNYEIVSPDTKILIVFSNKIEGDKTARIRFRKYYPKVLHNQVQLTGLEIISSGYYFISSSWFGFNLDCKTKNTSFFARYLVRPFFIAEYFVFKLLNAIGIKVKGDQGYLVCRKVK